MIGRDVKTPKHINSLFLLAFFPHLIYLQGGINVIRTVLSLTLYLVTFVLDSFDSTF